jgi:hypothetical protein
LMEDREEREKGYDLVRKKLKEYRGGKKPRPKADWRTANDAGNNQGDA